MPRPTSLDIAQPTDQQQANDYQPASELRYFPYVTKAYESNTLALQFVNTAIADAIYYIMIDHTHDHLGQVFWLEKNIGAMFYALFSLYNQTTIAHQIDVDSFAEVLELVGEHYTKFLAAHGTLDTEYARKQEIEHVDAMLDSLYEVESPVAHHVRNPEQQHIANAIHDHDLLPVAAGGIDAWTS